MKKLFLTFAIVLFTASACAINIVITPHIIETKQESLLATSAVSAGIISAYVVNALIDAKIPVTSTIVRLLTRLVSFALVTNVVPGTAARSLNLLEIDNKNSHVTIDSRYLRWLAYFKLGYEFKELERMVRNQAALVKSSATIKDALKNQYNNLSFDDINYALMLNGALGNGLYLSDIYQS